MPDEKSPESNQGVEDTSLHDQLVELYNKEDEPEDQVEETPESPPEKEEGRGRDEKGRFKAKSDQEEEAPPGTEEEPVEPSLAPPPELQTKPPSSWSATAKAAFKELPEAVKQSVAKREAEIIKGQETYRQGLETYKPLEPYIEMATSSGTTLPEALQRYVAAEQFLEQDPISGIKWLCQNYNISPEQLLDGMRHEYTNQTGQPAPQPPQADPRQYLNPIMQELGQLRQLVVGNEEAKVASEIDSFFGDYENFPYAENVADQMAVLLRSGQAEDLKTAYDQACWINPEIRGLLIKDQESARLASQAAQAKATATQARRAGRSITGGPSETPPPGTPEPDDLRAQLEAAFGVGRV